MKAVAYCRIAPEEEASLNAYAIEVQKSDIEAYSKDHDIEIVEYLVDHAGTGIKEPRPELDRILGGMLEEGVQAVLVASTDRLASNVKTYLLYRMQMSQKGYEVVCIEKNSGETGAGKFAPMLGRA